MLSTSTATPPRLRDGVEAVVIGVSAGAIDALGKLLPALPAAAPVAVLIVVHLPASAPSLLVELFAPRCALAVREAEDKEPIVPGTIYFAPPDYHLLVETDRRIALSVDEPVNYSRPAIDPLFESAAEVYGASALGVILTGASSDGARGLEAIRNAGGQTIVQDPSSAEASVMPSAAIRLAHPEHVLSLDAIAQVLGGLGRRSR